MGISVYLASRGRFFARVCCSAQFSWNMVTYTTPFSPTRIGHCVVALNGMLLVMGGDSLNSHYLNDVWGSTDGVGWTDLAPSPAFTPARYQGGCAVLGNQVMVVAGAAFFGPTILRDVWVSSTGSSWASLGEAPFEARYYPGVVAFQDKLFVVAGNTYFGTGNLNDVWHSPDGQNWDWATLSAGFSARYMMGLAVFQDHLWVVGGYAYELLNDV